MKTVTLACFPYAGGSSSIYAKWQRLMPDWIVLKPMELPGRGKRSSEGLITDFMELATDCYNQLIPIVQNGAYALFGYSMGTWLVYEIYRRIVHNNKNRPLHIFLAAKEPVHMNQNATKYHQSTDDEFLQILKTTGGFPEEISQSQELLNHYLPIIRADYKAIETYSPVLDGIVFDSFLTALVGSEDEVSEQEMLEWAAYSTKRFKCFVFKGGHFFIRNKYKGIIRLISTSLLEDR